MIFRFGNISIKLSFSFFALIVTMTLLCDEKIILCSVLSSLIHECGHLVFMFILDEKPSKIEFTLFGMRISKCDSCFTSYKNEILIALGGIIFNCIFGLVLFGLFRLSGKTELLIVSVVNFIIAAINSFPVSSLDLGRAIKYFMKYKETDESYFTVISYFFTVLFVLSSAIYTVFYPVNISLIAIDVYLIFITVIKKWS